MEAREGKWRHKRQTDISKKLLLKFPEQDSNPQSLAYMANAPTPAKSTCKHTWKRPRKGVSQQLKEKKLCGSS